MNGTDSTQLASDGKQASGAEFEISNHYNERFLRIEERGLPEAAVWPAHILNNVHRALAGISVINTILSNDTMSADNGCEPLDGYMTGGLHTAIQVMAELAIDKIEFYADSLDRRVEKNEAINDVVGAVVAIDARIEEIERAAAENVRDGSCSIWAALVDAKRALKQLDDSVERITREVHRG